MKLSVDPVGLEDYYLDYINKKNEENRQNRYEGKEGYYHASGAGFCSRKLYYQSIEKAKPTNETPSLGKMKMRFGSIFHDDFQEALVNNTNMLTNTNIYINTKNKEKNKVLYKKKVKFHVEQEIIIPELNVRGFYDVVAEQQEDEDTKIYLYDLKTVASYPWMRKFGRNITDTSENYKLQLGTYGTAVKEQFGRLDGMYLYFYNKDTSQIRSVHVSDNYLGLARNYWRNIQREHAQGVPQFIKGISPAEQWACGYCEFLDHCNPPDYKNKKR